METFNKSLSETENASETCDMVEQYIRMDIQAFIETQVFWTNLRAMGMRQDNPELQMKRVIFALQWQLMQMYIFGVDEEYLPEDTYIAASNMLLRPCIHFKAADSIIVMLAALSPLSESRPLGILGTLPIHEALLCKRSLPVVAALMKFRSTCQYRDVCGRTLLHWAVLVGSPLPHVEHLYESFIDSAKFPTHNVILPDFGEMDGVSGMFQRVCGEYDSFKNAALRCIPLCLALDMNMPGMLPRNNADVVSFLVGVSGDVLLVADSLQDIAFHKLLRAQYSPDVRKRLIITFAKQHSQCAQAAALVKNTQGHILLESAFALRLRGDIIDIIGRFTSNQLEPLFRVFCRMTELDSGNSFHHKMDLRTWSLVSYPLDTTERMQSLPPCGFPWVPGHAQEPYDLTDVEITFMSPEDTETAALPEFDSDFFESHNQRSPVQYRSCVQLVEHAGVFVRMLQDICEYIPGGDSSLADVLRRCQKMQKNWYKRYKREMRTSETVSDPSLVLTEQDAEQFFAPRPANKLLSVVRQVVNVKDSERHAEELLQMLLDEEERTKMGAATNASLKTSRKARKKEAQQEREVAAKQAEIIAIEQRDTALAIARVAKVAAQQKTRLEKNRRKEQALADQVDAEMAQALLALEIDVRRLEADSIFSKAATVNFVFEMIRAAMQVAQTNVENKEMRQQVVKDVLMDISKILDAHEALHSTLHPQMLALMSVLLPDYEERERTRQANELEIIALRAAAQEMVELRAAAEEVVALRAAAALEKEARECVVCLSNSRNVLLRPCNHFCLCETCWENGITECPLCRTAVVTGEVYFT